MTTEKSKSLGFRNTGFGCTVRSTEISVWIVVRSHGQVSPKFGVYLCHGAPAGRFWLNRGPLVERDTLREAQDVAEEIFGIAGSAEFAQIITAR